MKLEGRFVQVPHSLYKDSRLSAHEKLVWSALMLYADDKGRCYPTIATLAQDTGLDVHTVRRAIEGSEAVKAREAVEGHKAVKAREATEGLVQHGWLKVTVRKGTFSLYRLIVPKVSPRNKSGDVVVAFPNEVSRLSSGTSESTQDTLPKEPSVKHTVYTASDSECVLTGQGGASSQDTELYPWNYIQKISLRSPGKKETSLRIPGTKAKDNDETCRLDPETGHFVIGQAVRLRLEAHYPRIDYDKSLPLIEARLPRDKSKKVIPIWNALPYLDSCFADFRNCVVKYGEEVRHTDGTIGYCKVYTDEELSLLYHAPLPESALDSTFDQFVGDILAKRRDA